MKITKDNGLARVMLDIEIITNNQDDTNVLMDAYLSVTKLRLDVEGCGEHDFIVSHYNHWQIENGVKYSFELSMVDHNV